MNGSGAGGGRNGASGRLRRGWARLTRRMQPTVFFGSAGVVVGFVVFGGAFTGTAQIVFERAQSWIAGHLGWLYVLSTGCFVIFALGLALSRFGSIRLGEPDDRPEFSTASWIAMLFAAGMGMGLVFFGVAEPVMHWTSPPDAGAEPRSRAAILQALRLSFFHWGVHPWAGFALLGAALALMHFRHGLPLAPRSVLWPLLGDRIHGPIGHGVDILCTVGTLIGVATSLGLGALQINSGIEHMGWAAYERSVQLAIIAVITLVATISVVSGIHRGIQRLSQLNLILAGVLLTFVLLSGPSLFLIRLGITTAGSYVQELVGMSSWMAPLRTADRDWQRDWTLFYWGWWLSWSPFVGIFVARISRGRTLREFMVALLLGPVVLSFLWLSVFGGSGLAAAHGDLGLGAGDPGFVERVTETPAVALHSLLGHLPGPGITGPLATLLICIFFITSSDSGSLVDDMVTSGGHPDPPRSQRVFWAVSEGAVAATLLLTDGLDALRTAGLTVGLPMDLLLVLTAIGLVRTLRGTREPGDQNV